MMAAVTTPEMAGSSARPLFWTCAVFAGGALLNVDRVPPWAAAVALLLIAWRLLGAYRGGAYPGVAARALLALVLVAIVLVRFHTLNGLAAGTTLLLLMAGLKLLETRAARDQFVMVGAGLFLLLAACLDRQELLRAPLYGLQAWLCCGAAADIVAQVAERLQGVRDLRLRRLGYAPTTCPTTPALEELFYPNARTTDLETALRTTGAIREFTDHAVTRDDLARILEAVLVKAQKSGQPAVFDEITDDDIDNLFKD